MALKVNDVSFKDDCEEMEFGSKLSVEGSGSEPESENGNELIANDGHDTMDVCVPAHKARRVSFAESVDVIKQEDASGAGGAEPSNDDASTAEPSFESISSAIDSNICDSPSEANFDKKEPEIIGVLPEPDPNHPANEPEGLYLKQPVFGDEDVCEGKSE